MNKYFILIVIGLLHFKALSQSPRKILKKIGDNPVYFIDSVEVDHHGLLKYDPKEIATVNVLRGKEAAAIAGEDGKDGVIYIETIPFAIKRYKRYFSSKSAAYETIISNLYNGKKKF